MNRRRAILALALPMLGSCVAPRGATPMRPAASPLLDEETSTLLRYASFAPSRLNAQPWSVVVRAPRELSLSVDPARRLASDPAGGEATVALGAFAEALSVAGAALALDAEIDFDGVSARVTLRPSRGARGDLAILAARVTVATPLEPDPITCSLPAGVELVPRGTAEHRRLVQGTLESSMRGLAGAEGEELARWIRVDDESARRTRDGHTLASLGIDGAGATFLRLVGARAITLAPFRGPARAKLETLLEACAGLVLVRSDGTMAGAFDAGRRYLRLALAATADDVALHPLAAPVAAGLVPGAVLVARIGKVTRRPQPNTLRRPVSDFARLA